MTDNVDGRVAETALCIQRATLDHLKHVIDLDARITGQSKPDYWQDIFERYGKRRVDQRFFLVAEAKGTDGILGLIAGEVRGWEFGSQPCGWIFAVSVDPEIRQKGIGEALFKAICDEFRQAGMSTVRTMVRRQNQLHMSFFRSEGMMAGPYTQLEMSLDDE
ncbi:MAG: GNAT family N-acetyltransferase [Roseibium sp.]|uniref:GNAT family N-acetyltransferase n=1 Tax=Roseibium sp. TaxID=1936156 RepID=UPI002637E5B8|nr:GNAT family N-acetyltransferase [Roseibium sp.]MCV0427985.1 GNAT family N-acetyltransferase [Roseibium sp.]